MNIWIGGLLLLFSLNGIRAVEVNDLEANYESISDESSSEYESSNESEASVIIAVIRPNEFAHPPSRANRLGRMVMDLQSIEEGILQGIDLGTIAVPVRQQPAPAAAIINRAPIQVERVEPFVDLQLRWREGQSLMFDYLCKMMLIEFVLAVAFTVVQIVLAAYLTPAQIAQAFYWLMFYGFVFGSLLYDNFLRE